MSKTAAEIRQWLVTADSEITRDYNLATLHGPSMDAQIALMDNRIRALYSTVCTLLAKMAEDEAAQAEANR